MFRKYCLILPNSLRFLLAGLIVISLILGNQTVNGAPGGEDPNSQSEQLPNQEKAGSRSAILPESVSMDQLSDNTYSRRQRATLEMWRLRDVSRQAVQDASHHSDPEVAERANWILRQWRRGSLPDTPPEIARLLQNNDDPAVLEELLEVGQFRAVVVAIEESAGSVDRDLLHQRIAAVLAKRFPIHIRLALHNDSMLELLQLVDLVADSKEMAVCRIQLMQELGLDIDDNPLLPSASEHWTPKLKRESEVAILAVLGRLDEAIARAKAEGDESLVRVCRMLAGQWKSLADDAIKIAQNSDLSSIEGVRAWCNTLVAADRCDDETIRNLAVEAITSEDAAKDALSIDLRWKCLASHGYIDKAIELLRERLPDSAATVAMASARTDQAFAILGFNYEEIDTNLSVWIRDAIAHQQTSELPELHKKVSRLLSLMQCLLQVGREQEAWTIATVFANSSVNIAEVPLRDFVLQSLKKPNRDDWIVKFAVRPGDRTLSSDSEKFLVASMTDIDISTWKSLLDSITRLMPGVPFERQVHITYALATGEIPAEFDPEKDFPRLYDELVSGHNSLSPSVQRVLVRNTVPRFLNTKIVSFFSRLGQAELASRSLRLLMQRGDMEATSMVAENELDHGRAEIANEAFQRVWKQIAISHQSGQSYRRSSSELHFAVQAMVGQWVLASRQGHTEQEKELRRQLRLTLCSPSTEMRSDLLAYLAARGARSMASEGYQVLLRMTAFGSPEATELYDVAREYSTMIRKTDLSEAAKWFDLAVGGTLESTYFYPIAYVSLPVYVRRWKLEDAIKNQDAENASRHLERILRLDPLDIDVAERLLPMMTRVSDSDLETRETAPANDDAMKQVGEEAFNRIWKRGKQYVLTYPFDATSANNLAWVAAMNRRHLAEAATISEQAVYVEPDSAIFRDTLAEVLFLLGKKDAALKIEKGCVIDDPGQWHLHQQIKKYTAAMKMEAR
ncbi:hypothetical protein CA13_72820 [Planctomycetes bacterium CA13]|uniref:Tetratricopeptide repeat protein n=1 Tax=Novipirellula herctigrandis TaxID=2527986 RepID=A0A5C5YPI5_9BACT|nr:hypothetical protein CA13_72820 [Planctomycetes bacterium CA13]